MNTVRAGGPVKRIWLCILLLALAGWVTGCAKTPEPEATQTPTLLHATVSPAPTLLNEPAVVYENVLTDQRVISLVLEGFTDEGSMQALAYTLKQQNIPAVFFISGIVADEHPKTVQVIADEGFTIGNYGLSAAKDMQDNDIPTNMHLFKRGQELIAQAAGITPILFRCNGSAYTREVLQAAAAVGLQAGVKPNIFLNHTSFATQEQALLYVQKLSRGSILSIKLGQVLDSDEFGGLTYTMDNRAIDPQPFLSDNMEDTITQTYANITNVVGWLLDALDAEGYVVVTPEALQAERITMFDNPATLDDATLAMLNPNAYALPVTAESLDYLLTPVPSVTPSPAPSETPSPTKTPDKATQTDATTAPTQTPAPGGAVLVGDSITGGLQSYVLWMRQTNPDFMPELQFLTSDNFSIGLSQMHISDDSTHPLLDGERTYVAQGVQQLAAKTVLLMPGQADVRSYSTDMFLQNLKLMIYQIRQLNPQARIWLQAIPPGVDGRYAKPTNAQIFSYNLAMYQLCLQYGIPFLDVAFPLRDAQGNLPDDLCLDADTNGIHLNDAGCELWLESIARYLPN